MSTSEPNTQHYQGAPQQVAGQDPQPATARKSQQRTNASHQVYLYVSIGVLVLVTIASVVLLFLGDVEGRGARVTWTVIIFAVFVGLTAIDSVRRRVHDWFAPIAMAANIYMLGSLMVITWGTLDEWFAFSIVLTFIAYVFATRVLVHSSELLLWRFREREPQVRVSGLIAFLLLAISAVLFTLPMVFDAFEYRVGELYWKFAVAALIFTALGIAIYAMLAWFSRVAKRELRRREIEEYYRSVGIDPQAQTPPQVPTPQQPQQTQPQVQTQPQTPAQSQAPAKQQTVQSAPQVSPAPSAGAAPQLNPDGTLPWPTFANGQPLPAGPDGQPDFSVPGAPYPPHLMLGQQPRQ